MTGRYGLRRPRPERRTRPLDVPGSDVLLAAGLIAFDCVADRRRHLVDDLRHAEELAACAEGRTGEPMIVGLCGRRLFPDSMMTDPHQACPACVDAAAPRLTAATSRRAEDDRRRISLRRRWPFGSATASASTRGTLLTVAPIEAHQDGPRPAVGPVARRPSRGGPR